MSTGKHILCIATGQGMLSAVTNNASADMDFWGPCNWVVLVNKHRNNWQARVFCLPKSQNQNSQLRNWQLPQNKTTTVVKFKK